MLFPCVRIYTQKTLRLHKNLINNAISPHARSDAAPFHWSRVTHFQDSSIKPEKAALARGLMKATAVWQLVIDKTSKWLGKIR